MKHFPFWPTFQNIVQIISHLLDVGFKVWIYSRGILQEDE